MQQKKEKKGIDTIQPGRADRIYLAMSSQLSASSGCISEFGIYVHGSKLLGRQRNEYHLHSTASTFCGGDDDEGLIPVSDEADDMEAPA